MPEYLQRGNDYLNVGGKFARTLYFSPVSYPTFFRDDTLTELCRMNKTMVVSFDLVPLLMEEALKMVDSISLGNRCVKLAEKTKPE